MTKCHTIAEELAFTDADFIKEKTSIPIEVCVAYVLYYIRLSSPSSVPYDVSCTRKHKQVIRLSSK